MKNKTIYIISGCNGAGKTTASYTILPEILNCKEFVNADNIAVGLSPFQPEKVAFEAGRIMLERIEYLLDNNLTFAVETTLATKIYKSKLLNAIANGYNVKLLFFWLPNVEMAIDRVAIRVKSGGHNIPKDVILRRYSRGIENLFKNYIPLSNEWMVFDSSKSEIQMIAKGKTSKSIEVFQNKKWEILKNYINE
jgi:predicted ABC-type ATPase